MPDEVPSRITEDDRGIPVKRLGTPQDITLHGRSVAVVVSRELFDRLSGNAQSLVDFMCASPLHGGDDIQLDRNRSLPREIAF